MAVMLPRERWTDQRLDDFEKRVDERFDQIDRRLERMEADIRELRQTLTRMNENMNRNFIAPAMLIVAAVVFF